MINTVLYSNNKPGYLVNKYAVDTAAEFKNLPTDCAMGSEAVIIETGDKYILNGSKQWVKQPQNTGGGSSSSDDDIVVLDSPSSASDDNIIIL